MIIRIKSLKRIDGIPPKYQKPWIGLELPCTFKEDIDRQNPATGKMLTQMSSHVVTRSDGLDALKKKSKKAYEWWKAVTEKSGSSFVFSPDLSTVEVLE